jgi:hypothetical protein
MRTFLPLSALVRHFRALCCRHARWRTDKLLVNRFGWAALFIGRLVQRVFRKPQPIT